VLRWLENLRKGESINADISKMPEDETAFLTLFGVKGIYFVPIFMKGEFWGVVTLEDHTTYRSFDEDCLDLLQSAAHLCASVIVRAEMELAVTEVNERVKILLDTTPLCCQLWDRNHRMIDCNEEAVNLFGMKNKQEFLEEFYKFSPEYQQNGRRTDEMVTELLEEAFTKGKGTFTWVYNLPDGSLMPAEGVLVRIKYKDDYAVAVYTRDLREHNRMMEEIKHRDELLQTVNNAAAILLRSDPGNFVHDLHQSMGMLAAVVEVDRVRIWKNQIENDELHCAQVYEWAGGADPQQNSDLTINMSFKDKLPGWEASSMVDVIMTQITVFILLRLYL
jgi:PAS domain-containing protein